ncbi:MAG: pyridoxal 5'-phosphate synthase glutaminase subunit PdxT [Terriglobales bacterium]
MNVGVLALQGDFDAHAAALARLGCAAVLVRQPHALEALDGLILPGGESTTMLKFLQQGGFWERLAAFVQQRPVFGTCAGAILLARHVTAPAQPGLGALDLTVVRNAYGRQLDSSIRTAHVRPEHQQELGAAELEAVLIRAPLFQRLGPGVEVLAESDGQPVLVRQGHVLAATFHPELSRQSHLHRYFLLLAARNPQAPSSRGRLEAP